MIIYFDSEKSYLCQRPELKIIKILFMQKEGSRKRRGTDTAGPADPRQNRRRKSPAKGNVGRTPTRVKTQGEGVRLNKYIAGTGLCSRREADELIRTGLITINGKVTTTLGVKVTPSDVVKYNGKKLKEEKKIYILLNKPKDYISTTDDPFAKKKVTDLVQNACRERLYPVGRLDRMTTGVLLLTNDGDLATKLTHPKYNRKKIYHVFLHKNVKKTDLDRITEGIELEDGKVFADAVSFVDPDDRKQIGIEIHSGKNRVIRRIFEHLGYRIVKLDRVYFAGLTKKGLSRGSWRFLKEKEITMLKTGKFR
ncbi:MAG: rRNA pseudouridine synthase [Bacteroidales bacterium]|nr:MAG: rRNA pseudouridine synthase [Bacteroidales bacterium]